MYLKDISLAALAAIVLFGSSDAFWRINCGKIQVGRIDPIVSPGKISTHVHTILGSSNLGINSTYQTLNTAQCTSCEVQADKSAYWSPLLYYQYKNGSFTDVFHNGGVMYYIGRGAAQNNLVPFPPGFQMLTGDSLARSYDNTTMTWGNATYPGRPVADRVSFACLSTTPGKETPGLNSTNCVNGLRAQIHYQSCWDGVNLYKSDNSHVAYMSQIDNGVCPPTHPVPFVHLFMEVNYSVNRINQTDGGRFVFSTGDTTGYGFHADFQNGWDQDVLTQAVAQCASVPNSSGDIDDCPVLLASDIDNTSWQCPRQPNQLNETTEGILPKLPGCINITSGPNRALSSDQTCPASVTPPYATPTVDSVAIQTVIPQSNQQFGRANQYYVGCSNDSTAARALNNGGGGAYVKNTTNISVESCQDYCTGKGYKFSGLENGQECWCDQRISSVAVFGNTGCNYRCSGTPTENCGGSFAMDIFNNTAIAQVPLPSVVPAVGKYISKGCYAELSSGRALAGASTAADTITVNTCTKFCLGKGFRWAGVEYGRECYCGSSYTGTGKIADSKCSMTCKGNSGQVQQMCGGSGSMNIYYSSTL